MQLQLWQCMYRVPLANVEAAFFKAVGFGARKSMRHGTEMVHQRSEANLVCGFLSIE